MATKIGSKTIKATTLQLKTSSRNRQGGLLLFVTQETWSAIIISCKRILTSGLSTLITNLTEKAPIWDATRLSFELWAIQEKIKAEPSSKTRLWVWWIWHKILKNKQKKIINSLLQRSTLLLLWNPRRLLANRVATRKKLVLDRYPLENLLTLVCRQGSRIVLHNL